MSNQAKAYAFALTTVVLWSTVASAFKISLRYVDPWQLLLYACCVSIVVLGSVAAVTGKLPLLLRCTKRQYLLSLVLGLLNPLGYYAVLFKAYDMLPAQVAQPLNYTWALTLAYLSVFLLGQKLAWPLVAAGLVCYGGVVIIGTQGSWLSFRVAEPAGVALALGSTILWSLYWICHTRDRREPVVGLLLNFIFALPFVLGACCCFSDWRVSDPRGWLGAAYVGLFEMGITFILWLNALRLSRSTALVANLIFLCPFVSLFFIHLLVGERIVLSTWIGLVFILAGLLIQRWGSRHDGNAAA